jgi:Tfp pilus assembly protein PilX
MLKHTKNDQSGGAMIISLLALMLMTMVGMLMMAQTKTETQIAGFDMRSTQALYHAEAGYAEALARLSVPDTSPQFIGPADDPAATPGWGVYLVGTPGDAADDPDYSFTETDGMDNDADGFVDESGERYPEVVSAQSGDMDYPWVKVEYKRNAGGQVILYGDHDDDPSTPSRENLLTGEPMLRITAQGNRGTAERIVEIEASRTPFMLPGSALYAETDDFQFAGSQFLVSGLDWDPRTGGLTGDPGVSGIATTEDPAEILNDLGEDGSSMDWGSGDAGSDIAGTDNNVEGDTGQGAVVGSSIDYDLQAMADLFIGLADIEVSSSTFTQETWGTWDDYQVVHATGDLFVSGQTTGSGVLVVSGDLDISGQLYWTGLVLVLGDLKYTGAGSHGHVYGAVMTQGMDEDQMLGGNANIRYSRLALNRLTDFMPYQVANWREI